MTSDHSVSLPVRPGEYLRNELAERDMTQAEFAERCRRPAQVINEIINGRKRITAATALDFERVLGTSAELWVNLQAQHDLATARGQS